MYFATSQHVFLEAQPEQKLPSYFLLPNPTPSKEGEGGGGRGAEISSCGHLYLPSLSPIEQVLHAICVNIIILRKHSSPFLSLEVNVSYVSGKEWLLTPL